MKKIVRLTENDITRIVKRVMNEAKGPLLLGDPDDDRDSDSYSTGPDSHPDDKDFRNGVVKRVLNTLRKAAYYTKGTRHSADNIIRHYIDKGHDVIMYAKGGKKYFIETMTGRIFDESDKEVGQIKNIKQKLGGEMDRHFRGMFGGWDVNESKGNRMNEALGLLDKKNDLPGGIVKRKITDYASAKRYTMGTKVSADLIMRLIERGGSVFMYTDRSSDKIFIDTLSKGAYDQLDRRIGEVTGNMDDWAMDYFDDSMNESLYEGYDYPKRKSIGTIKGRKLTLDNFSKYIMGTKISAKTIESYLEDGDDIIMYSNGPKRVFVNYTDGKAYNEKDRLITNIKRKESFDELEDYLES